MEEIGLSVSVIILNENELHFCIESQSVRVDKKKEKKEEKE